ncbi:CAP domain-containing protein [Thiomicrospira sp. S5]|uniref:CAP domain-containing protein n=1 Tax=Thiomicrospira sp. S5 TaxID=1803865 RepID=UPI000F8A1FCC|nr:CAP domain-containing protein [Thiomicrospira sp. S5]AZR81141.1 hypothetical protein AYJ59_01800 [Thiomicrospira sp. S5]
MVLRLLIYLLVGLFVVWFFTVGLERIMTPPKDLSDIPALQKTYQKTPTIRPVTLQMAQAQEAEALRYLNRIRQSLQLNPLSGNAKLAEAARHHANYSTLNNIQAHPEQPGLAGFTGETPQLRANAAGYQSPVAEVIAYNHASPYPMVDDLMSAIYHRLGLLNMTQDQIGIGVAGNGEGQVKSALVGLLGNKALEALCEQPPTPKPGALAFTQLCPSGAPIPKRAVAQAMSAVAKTNPKLVAWPKSGASVPPVFYEESPDPLPECNVSGYPVHVQINPIFVGRIQFDADSFKLYELEDEKSRPVKAAAIFGNRKDPNRQEDAPAPNKDQWIAFFPQQRLNWNSRYQAEIQYWENHTTKTMRWNFFTEKQPGLVEIRQSQTLSIREGQTLTLYFPPKSCHNPDGIRLQRQIPPGINAQARFVDGETLQVTLKSAPFGGAFNLRYQPGDIQIRFEVDS